MGLSEVTEMAGLLSSLSCTASSHDGRSIAKKQKLQVLLRLTASIPLYSFGQQKSKRPAQMQAMEKKQLRHFMGRTVKTFVIIFNPFLVYISGT